MAITTYSYFHYGHTIDESNKYLCFIEGAGTEKIAILDVGSYTLTKFRDILAQALNNAGTLLYTVTVDRATRIITITAPSTFKFLGATGSRTGQQVLNLAGFSDVDSSLATSHVGSFGSGSFYEPQFILQEYIDPKHNKSLANATVSKSADGSSVSIQSFGTVRMMKCNIKYATNIPQVPGDPIKSNDNGVEDLISFMEYCVTGAPIEFIADIDNKEIFYRVRLDSTEANQNGVEYELKERYDIGLPFYFDTGKLTFRVVTE